MTKDITAKKEKSNKNTEQFKTKEHETSDKGFHALFVRAYALSKSNHIKREN